MPFVNIETKAIMLYYYSHEDISKMNNFILIGIGFFQYISGGGGGFRCKAIDKKNISNLKSPEVPAYPFLFFLKHNGMYHQKE